MTLNIDLPLTSPDLKPKITVVGVGGAGGNAVNNMIQSNLGGVDFLVTNTDAQALQQSLCERHIQLGRNITQGLGAGSRPDIGRAAAEEALDEILVDLEGAHMVFVTAGMGGGTGTGAAPVIARAAREAGILTVGVITKPFHFEGVHRMRLAEQGIEELGEFVDTLIIIPNQNLFRIANEKTTFADAFKMADDVLESGVRGVTDLMVNPGLINLDFADIRSVMSEMGKAMMGTGEAAGEGRAVEAAEAAISNPLLDDVSMKGARGVLINITGGPDLTLFEVDEAANRIRDEVDPEANIIFGSTFDQTMENLMRVSVVATGIDADVASAPKPVPLSLVPGRARSMTAPAPTAEAPGAVGLQARLSNETGLPQPSLQGQASAAQAVAMQSAPMTAEAAPEPAPEPVAEPVASPSTSEEAPLELSPAMAEPKSATFESGFPFAKQQATPAVSTPVQSDAAPTQEESSYLAPPPPVRVEREDLHFSAGRTKADAMAEADMVNASPKGATETSGLRAPEERPPMRIKQRESLFSKVTHGAAKALQAATSGLDDSGQAKTAAASQAEATAAPPVTASPAPAAPSQEVEAPEGRVTEQPSFSGMDAPERAKSTEIEEDLLDIPAFLRRQAN